MLQPFVMGCVPSIRAACINDSHPLKGADPARPGANVSAVRLAHFRWLKIRSSMSEFRNPGGMVKEVCWLQHGLQQVQREDDGATLAPR
jgi:hypothetical protein